MVRALSFFKEKRGLSGCESKSKISFFGGEPLLRFDLLKQGTERADQIFDGNVTFSMSTNGTLLNDESLSLLSNYKFSVLISYDGKTFDTFRGSGNFNGEFLRKKIFELSDAIGIKKVTVAVTVHNGNLDLCSVIPHLIDMGIVNIKVNFDFTDNSPYSLREEDYKFLIKQAPDLVKLMFDHPEVHLAIYSPILDKDLNLFTGRLHCSACASEITVDTRGDVYPCPLFVGNDTFKIGNVNENTCDFSLIQKVVCLLDKSTNNCRDCPVRGICYGHCLVDGGASEIRTIADLDGRNKWKCELLKVIAYEKIKILESMKKDMDGEI